LTSQIAQLQEIISIVNLDFFQLPGSQLFFFFFSVVRKCYQL